MKSGSWASYRAAMPPECFGEPDDDPPRRWSPKCAGCGRFVPRGTPAQSEPASHAGEARDWWICPACVGRVPTARTPEQCAADDAAAWAAYDAAMREAWEDEAREAAQANAEAAEERNYEAAWQAADPPIEPYPSPDDDPEALPF